ncbi:TonB-dependent receptor [Psychroflexus sediminis]|uniref:Iron complex outermembrane recepter protein n=1 Tax=Psychroflexus sediminis TaxID=470826 RepID=A0A1G7WUL3_9FLAO|nr:TonB-dependent receptor [Psychroflexus sediminis]SDG74980.1 iron complex outermembrane recepter protein [Psychroflexus sediminis]
MKQFSIIIFFISGIIFSQTQNETTALEEVKLKTSLDIEKEYQSELNVSYLNQQELLQSNQTSIAPFLNKIPGVYMQQGGLNTAKINIRGIGARAQYETNRIKLYYNNIPLTSANGTSILNDIDLTIISEVKVMKGPQASEFGAGLGGVIQLSSVLKNQNYTESELLFGSYDLLKQNFVLNVSEGNKKINLTYNNLSSGGFRENSNYQRESYFLNSEWNLSKTSKLQLVGQVIQLKGYIPSSLSGSSLEEDPSQAAFTWGQARGYESYTRGVVGINFSNKLGSAIQQNTAVFTNIKDAFEPRPFDILQNDNVGIGVRHTSELDFDFFGFSSKLSLGGEFLGDDYEVSTFENLYEQNDGQGYLQGNLLSDLTQTRQYIEGFATLEVALSRKLEVNLGLATNKTRYDIQDLFSSSGNSQTGDYSYDQVWLPNLVGTYAISENQKISASISKGFSVPTVEQSLTEEGVFNTELKPEMGWNYEIGYKSKWFADKFFAEVNAYYMDVENLLVARRVAEDRFVGINAGSTSHPGIEFSLKSNLNYSSWLKFQPYINGSFNFYEFDEFVDQGQSFSGNDLTGVPSSQFSFGLDAQIADKFFFYYQTNAVSEIPVNDENTVFTESYAVSLLNAEYRFSLFDSFTAGLSLGVNNLFNEKYASSIVTNAIGFGGSEPRYFYPGEPRNYFGSLSLNYAF